MSYTSIDRLQYGLWLGWMLAISTWAMAVEPDIIDIGSRRELFVDRFLIDHLDHVHLELHRPRPAETVLRFDRPYEGPFSAYVTVIKDGPVYRMYYRGLGAVRQGHADHSVGKEVTCYAESRDGIHFTKPDLGLYEINGSRANNVILAGHPACHNFCPFLDARPGVDPSERYKAVGGKGERKRGLFGFVSADGIHWRQLGDEPLITRGAFDSQNVAFWSESENCYVAYFRTGKRIGARSYRWISRSTSPDFVNWSEPVEMDMGDAPPEHYYTNQTSPYFRAPHIYIATPARFFPGRQVVSTQQAEALGIVGDYYRDCSEGILMTSRGGHRYDRTFLEGFIRPGLGPANWVSRTNYPALGIVPTGPGEMSLYVRRHSAQSTAHMQRMTLRTDGFVSVRASYAGGQMITKPLRFEGTCLEINVATSAAGSVRIEIQDPAGRPIEGYALADADEIIGDQIDRICTWRGSPDVSSLAGRPVRLRFVMKDADLYAIRFR